MKLLLLFLVFFSVAVNAQEDPAIRSELLAMEKVDQDARIKCTNGTADEQTKCLADISKAIDEPNTKRLTRSKPRDPAA